MQATERRSAPPAPQEFRPRGGHLVWLGPQSEWAGRWGAWPPPEEWEQQAARLVELRYFGGLTVEETADVLGSSPATVKRHWAMARAWLKQTPESTPSTRETLSRAWWSFETAGSRTSETGCPSRCRLRTRARSRSRR